MTAISSDGGQVTLLLAGAQPGGDSEQVHVTARTQRGSQDVLIQAWFNRDEIENALEASRRNDRAIMLEPAA